MPTDTATDTADAPDPMQDADAWQALSREEQHDILDDGLADLKGETDGEGWRHLSDGEQRNTIAAIERSPDGGHTPGDDAADQSLSATEQAMQAALSETWTAHIFEDLDDVPTVPFECRELDTEEQTMAQDAFRALGRLERDAERLADEQGDVDEDDLVALDIESEFFDSPQDIEAWLPEFLASVTTDDAFDAERWRTGRGVRSNTMSLLLIEIALRYREESERAIKFRAER